MCVPAFLLCGVHADAPGSARDFRAHDARARALLEQMTLAEKIGQLTQAELGNIGADYAAVEELLLGSVLSGGGADPRAGNTLEAWTAMYDAVQRRALNTRLAIPLLYGVDAVHGHNNVLGAVIFPHNIGLGCANDPALVERVARITALETRATGIHWTFAPCVTVPRDIRWGRTYEGYSSDPQIVSVLGAAAVRGLQGKRLDDPLSLLACAKHFAGDGGTIFGTGRFESSPLDQGDAQCDERTLRAVHLFPYRAAIAAGAGTIMPSYSSWNGVKCTGNKYLLTDVLKGEFGFEGFLISDYNAIDQLAKDYKEAIAIAINAGIDMAMVPKRYREFIAKLTELVEEGHVPLARIDDAVTRILRVKAALGLLDQNRTPFADRSLHAQFGSAEHRAVAREAVRRSIVLLKNENNILPLPKKLERIHVAGAGADDLGMQCGGWTIDWQGRRGNVTPGGTTILEAIRATVAQTFLSVPTSADVPVRNHDLAKREGEAPAEPKAGAASLPRPEGAGMPLLLSSDSTSSVTQITYSPDGGGAQGATVCIAVIGEAPYAEGRGDVRDLALNAADRQLLRTLKQSGAPVIVILISGRPLLLEGLIDQADTVLAAWLPGTEGAGVADVLFGDHPPTGKLSFPWPRAVSSRAADSPGAELLFPAGFGLTFERR